MKISLLVLTSLFIGSFSRHFADAARAGRHVPCRVLLLDLDETLVFSSKVDGRITGITARNHTQYFLTKAKQVFSHVFILSSGTQPYVEHAVKILPGGKHIDGVYGRKFNTRTRDGAMHQKVLVQPYNLLTLL